MIIGELPNTTGADSEETAPPVAEAAELVALAGPVVVPVTPSIRARLRPRETGPPRSARERLARLQVLHL